MQDDISGAEQRGSWLSAAAARASQALADIQTHHTTGRAGMGF